MVGRDLLPEECRTYLHRQACPEPRAAAGSAGADVYTVSGVVPVERLASGSLAGTRVDIAAQLPIDLTPFLETLARDSGIEVTGASGDDVDLGARVAAADLPDLAIVERPAVVAELARAGLLVDMSGFVDVARLRSSSGDYLVRLGSVGVDGTWPVAGGHLYGAPFATEAGSLVWYPRAAFERAGYSVPRTWDELQVLTSKMVADGAAPWCLGVEAGTESGASAVAFIEEMVLRAGGPDAYDSWAAGTRPFIGDPTRGAFRELGDVAFRDGYVLNGAAAALHTPEELAAWPMFVDPPECWLHLAGGTARLSWPVGGSATLAAFPFPAADPAHADEVRGRAFSLVVFHDRPEVRRFVEALLGDQVAAAATSSFARAGIWLAAGVDPALGLDEVQARESALLRAALRAGTFHVAASDLMPTRLAAALAQGTVTYLTWGQVSLGGVLGDIEEVRQTRN
jgi:alpha-glucoside transport system substrate-binding protein